MATATSQWEGLVENMGQLCLAEKTAVKLDSSKSTYILEIAVQNGEDPLIAAATSKYEIHILSRNYLTAKGILTGHSQKVTGISFGKSEHHSLFSSSADRTVRCWDSRTPGDREDQKFEAPANVRSEILCVDTNQSDILLCAGTESVDDDETYILFWDRRMNSLLGSYTESHDNDINQVRFKPGSENTLASGSSDGLVCTFDLNNTSEDDSLQMTFNADSDVERIGWCGQNFDDVYCVTTDSTFYVWDSLEGDDRCHVSGPGSLSVDVKGEPIEYLVDCIPQYTGRGDNPNEALVIAGSYSGCISLMGVSSNGDSQIIKRLSGGHDATIRCSSWDVQTRTLLTAGEDACLCLWSVENGLSSSKNITKTSQVLKKQRKSQESKKPYSKHK